MSLKVSCEKTKHIDTLSQNKQRVNEQRVQISERWVQSSGLDKEANKGRARKLDLIHKVTQSVYKKQEIY